jgi:large subunit ribosomal protein L10
MKKVGLVVREKIVEEIKDKVKDTHGCFFVNFNKVKAYPYNMLRNNLRTTGANLLVTKNSLFKRAFEDLGWKDLEPLLAAELGVVFVYDKDIVKVCKILVEFSKEHEVLQLKGGLMGDKVIEAAQVNVLAKLPSREVILAMAVSSLASPLTAMLSVLNQTILKLLWVVEEIKKVKEQDKK